MPITVSGRTTVPRFTFGSRPPHTPEEITSGRPSSSRSAGRRVERRPALSPTGATQRTPFPKAGNENDLRRGSPSARARARASSSTAVSMRIGPKLAGAGRGHPQRLLLLLALDPGLPAIARRGVFAGELDGGDVTVGDGKGPVALLVVELDEGLGHICVAVEDVADDLAAIRPHDRGVAAVVECEVDHLAEGRVFVDLRNPPLETHGDYSFPDSVTATVSAKLLRELNVSATA